MNTGKSRGINALPLVNIPNSSCSSDNAKVIQILQTRTHLKHWSNPPLHRYPKPNLWNLLNLHRYRALSLSLPTNARSGEMQTREIKRWFVPSIIVSTLSKLDQIITSTPKIKIPQKIRTGPKLYTPIRHRLTSNDNNHHIDNSHYSVNLIFLSNTWEVVWFCPRAMSSSLWGVNRIKLVQD